MNASLASKVLAQLQSLGAQEVCICPSARNAPFVPLLKDNPSFKTYYFFEERSMAFFALGRIRRTGRPVAVLTTSGTAAGELLPAVMEAHYAGLPLAVVTADRPRHFRETGAPQTAEQVGLFGVYAVFAGDFACEEEVRFESGRVRNRPFHFNICFDEPLLDGDGTDWDERTFEVGAVPSTLMKAAPASGDLDALSAFIRRTEHPIAIVGQLLEEEREPVIKILRRWNIPVYCEALSGLREVEGLCHLVGSERWIENAARADYPIDGVLRIGGVPTLRFWRDLEDRLGHIPVMSVSRVPFSGLGRSQRVGLVAGDLSIILPQVYSQIPRPVTLLSSQRFLDLNQRSREQLEELLRSEPLSEPGMFLRLSQAIPGKAQIYLGNSLPIREWDLAATRENRGFNVWGSRGLNGIDGQVSSFLGFADRHSENWGIIGDLTALYDLPGPWILSQMKETCVRLVVVNNGGGRIFSRMFEQIEFQNEHAVRFEAWAKLWGIDFECWDQVPDRIPSISASSVSHQMIEMVPNPHATDRFWRKYKEI